MQNKSSTDLPVSKLPIGLAKLCSEVCCAPSDQEDDPSAIYLYTTRLVDQRLMNDDDIKRKMHSVVGMRQFSDISQTDAANSIYAPLDNLLAGKLDRHH